MKTTFTKKKKSNHFNKTKSLKGGNSNYINHYLDNLHIKSHDGQYTNEQLKTIIYEKSFGDVPYFVKAKREIFKMKSIKNNTLIDKNNSVLKKEWIQCNRDCFKLCRQYLQYELNSTAYYLRLLTNSIISMDDGFVQFVIHDNDVQSISGIWNDDKNIISISFIGNDNVDKTRLIMGFGPSASGKTFWAKSIIRMFNIVSKDFPKTFLSIDGGLYREVCQIYQFIVRAVKNKGYGGFTNLVLAGISLTQKSMFNSDTIKNYIIDYLKKQKQSNNSRLHFSLYVPETLGSCEILPGSSSCSNKYKKYIDIANDSKSWIGLNIYQHITGVDCEYDDEFKCVGCTESGRLRQTNEGKEYSSDAWKYSKKNGDKHIMKAPGGSFIIHNSGGKTWIDKTKNTLLCKSIITDRKPVPFFSPQQIVNIENNFHCVYIHQP
jgi:hypothetical protein